MALTHLVKSRLPPALRALLKTGQRFGVNITPNHFYSEIADMRHLLEHDYWRKPYSMHGVLGTDIDAQAHFVQQCCEPFLDLMNNADLYTQACQRNGEPGYGPVEGLFLYAYLRRHQPRKIVQVGCGVTTALVLEAIRDETDYEPEIVCIEPYPTDFLKQLAASDAITLIPDMAQSVPIDQLVDVGSDGMLFVDSTHSLRVGSEVIRLISEVLPRLPVGARVHFHDIPFPYDFTPKILNEDLFIFREPVLLHGFLVNNSGYKIEASLAMLHHQAPEKLIHSIPAYHPLPTKNGLATSREGHFPSSIFLRVIKPELGLDV